MSLVLPMILKLFNTDLWNSCLTRLGSRYVCYAFTIELLNTFLYLFILDVSCDDVTLVDALLVDERHGQVELLGQDARPPGASLVRRAHHRLLPVRNILLDPPATLNHDNVSFTFLAKMSNFPHHDLCTMSCYHMVFGCRILPDNSSSLNFATCACPIKIPKND